MLLWKKANPSSWPCLGKGKKPKACGLYLCPPPLEYRLFYYFLLTKSMEQPAGDSEENEASSKRSFSLHSGDALEKALTQKDLARFGQVSVSLCGLMALEKAKNALEKATI